jgi:hypothetical protein
MATSPLLLMCFPPLGFPPIENLASLFMLFVKKIKLSLPVLLTRLRKVEENV